jgi:glycosyltransferase involved in cell wall biosynthesis
MRILFCNKYNYPFSGTETYLFAAMDLLRSKGHEAALFSMADSRGRPTPYDRHFVAHIDFKQPGLLRKGRLAIRAIYSREARPRLRALIQEFHPDIAHVRNIYHHLSPSIFWELKAQKIPVLYHINDFKLLCPSYNLVSQGETCESCKHGRFWRVVPENCYPGMGARFALAAEAYFHKWLKTYEKCVDCFLAPSEFVRDKFVDHGWDRSKFEVLAHFQSVNPIAERDAAHAPLLYFGRLSAEKGVADLLHAMKQLPNLRLVLAGDGPERPRLEQMAAGLRLANVEFVGHIGGEELDRAIAGSRFTILPTHAYETLGKTILECYAHGRTVITTDLGSRRELVQQGVTGLLYKTGDVEQLASFIAFLSSRPELADKMGRMGWETVRRDHAADTHYDSLIRIYTELIERKRISSIGMRRVEPRPGYIPAPDREPQRNFVSIQNVQTAPYLPSDDTGTAKATPHEPKLRVAFIGGRGLVSKYSGIETYYEEVGRRLAQMGHEVTAYCRTYFTPPLTEQNGMRVVRLPTIRSKHFETLVHTLLSTLHVLRQPVDIVHYHALGPALFSFIPRLAGKKTVVTVQGLDWQRKKWGRFASMVLRLGERAAVRLPDETIAVSRALQEHFRQQYGAETTYTPNGGLLREKSLPNRIHEWGLEPGKYILFLGRFSPEKNCHLLIDAYERLAYEKLTTDVKLVLAGASSYCDDYSRQLRTHAKENVKLLNWVSGSALDELLTNAMIFVLPSDLEGLSLALLDAMGAGLCVPAGRPKPASANTINGPKLPQKPSDSISK